MTGSDQHDGRLIADQLAEAVSESGVLEVRLRDLRDVFGYPRLTAKARDEIDRHLTGAGITVSAPLKARDDFGGRLAAAGLEALAPLLTASLDDWVELRLTGATGEAPVREDKAAQQDTIRTPPPAAPEKPAPPRTPWAGWAGVSLLLVGGVGVGIGASLWTPMAAIGAILLIGLVVAFSLRGMPARLVGAKPLRMRRIVVGGAVLGLIIGVPACTTSVVIYQREESRQEELLSQAETAVQNDDEEAVEDLWPLLAFARDDDDRDRWLLIAAYRKNVRLYREASTAERTSRWRQAASRYGMAGQFRDAPIRQKYATGRHQAADTAHMAAAVSFFGARGYRDAGAREKRARTAESAAIQALIRRSRSQSALTRLKAAQKSGGIPRASQLTATAKERIAGARRDLAAAERLLDSGDYSGALAALDASPYAREFPRIVSRLRSTARDFLDRTPGYGGGAPSVDLPNFNIPFIPFI